MTEELNLTKKECKAMTKRHFIALADALRLPGEIPASVRIALSRSFLGNHPIALSEAAIDSLVVVIVQAVANDLARFCKQQNANFDRERWLDYIAGTGGPNGGKVAKRG